MTITSYNKNNDFQDWLSALSQYTSVVDESKIYKTFLKIQKQPSVYKSCS